MSQVFRKKRPNNEKTPVNDQKWSEDAGALPTNLPPTAHTRAYNIAGSRGAEGNMIGNNTYPREPVSSFAGIVGGIPGPPLPNATRYGDTERRLTRSVGQTTGDADADEDLTEDVDSSGARLFDPPPGDRGSIPPRDPRTRTLIAQGASASPGGGGTPRNSSLTWSSDDISSQNRAMSPQIRASSPRHGGMSASPRHRGIPPVMRGTHRMRGESPLRERLRHNNVVAADVRSDGSIRHDRGVDSCGFITSVSQYNVFIQYDDTPRRGGSAGNGMAFGASSRRINSSYRRNNSAPSVRGIGRGNNTSFSGYTIGPSGRTANRVDSRNNTGGGVYAAGFMSSASWSLTSAMGSMNAFQLSGGASGRAKPSGIYLGGDSGKKSIRFFPKQERDDAPLDREDSIDPKDRLKGMRDQRERKQQSLENDERSGAFIGSLRPACWRALSPDALSSFSKGDPDALVRNKEVRDATKVMIQEVVPMVAARLTGLPENHQQKFDLAIELHRHGVNIRHLGLVRCCIEDTENNSTLRDMMLTEMVARTLKNVLRSFQRKWMKNQRSTSEQGMRMLVVKFLNLVTGAHVNSDKFWRDDVMVGVLQRFGVEALTQFERQHLRLVITRDKSNILKTCIFKLTQMQGLILTEAAENQFAGGEDPMSFAFVVADIEEIRPIVRYMHILDYGGGIMLSMEAQKLASQEKVDERIVTRLNCVAKQLFMTAYQSLPDDKDTRSHLLNLEEEQRCKSSNTGGSVYPDPVDFIPVSGASRALIMGPDEPIVTSPRRIEYRLKPKASLLVRAIQTMSYCCAPRACLFTAPQPIDPPLMRSGTHSSGNSTGVGTNAGSSPSPFSQDHDHAYVSVNDKEAPTEEELGVIHLELGEMPDHAPLDRW